MPKWAYGIAALAALLIWKGESMYSTIRGLRNNNPGNLEANGIPWDGLRRTQTDGRFYQFTSPEWGIRALGKVLLNYQRLHGLDTVGAIIDRYAPPVENNTNAYAASVAAALGVSIGETINVERRLPELVAAVIKHENGIQPYSEAFIASSLNLIEGVNYAVA